MDAKLKHLEMIQGVINRMANCSFLLKGWSVTLIAALFDWRRLGNLPLLRGRSQVRILKGGPLDLCFVSLFYRILQSLKTRCAQRVYGGTGNSVSPSNASLFVSSLASSLFWFPFCHDTVTS